MMLGNCARALTSGLVLYHTGIMKNNFTTHIPSDGTCFNPSSSTAFDEDQVKRMKHIVKILTLLVAISAVWIGLLHTSLLPRSYTWLLPIYLVVSLGCYGLLMVGVGLMRFPTCPHEAVLLQQDIVEAKGFLKQRGVDVSSSD